MRKLKVFFTVAALLVAPVASAGLFGDMVKYMDEAKKQYEEQQKAKAELDGAVESLSQTPIVQATTKAAPASWSELSCTGFVNESKLDIRKNRTGSVCSLSQDLLDSKVMESSVLKGSLSQPFALNSNPNGRSLREALEILRETAKSKNGVPALYGAPGAKFTIRSEDNSTYTVQAFASISGDNKNQDVYIEAISRTFCAEDPTNSLSGENTFRSSLISRYGANKKELSAQQLVPKAVAVRDKVQKDIDNLKKIGMNTDMYILALVPYNTAIQYYQSMGTKTAHIIWDESATTGDTLEIIDAGNDCSLGKRFIINLATNKSADWVRNIISEQRKNELDRSKTAATPTL